MRENMRKVKDVTPSQSFPRRRALLRFSGWPKLFSFHWHAISTMSINLWLRWVIRISWSAVSRLVLWRCRALLCRSIFSETSTNELKSFIRSCTNATLVTQLNQILPNFEIHPNQEYILSRIQSTPFRFLPSTVTKKKNFPSRHSLGSHVLVRLYVEIRRDYRCWAGVQSVLHLLRSTSDTRSTVLGWQSLPWKLCSPSSTINKSVEDLSFASLNETATKIVFSLRYRSISDGSVCLPGEATGLQSCLQWWYSWYSSCKWTLPHWCIWSSVLEWLQGDHNLLDSLLLFVECINSNRSGHLG